MIYKNWPNDAKDGFIFTLNNYSIVTTSIELENFILHKLNLWMIIRMNMGMWDFCKRSKVHHKFFFVHFFFNFLSC
jgi:hypothetical protein